MKTIRSQFIQQMQLKGYSQNTIQSYVECLIGLSKFHKASPDLPARSVMKPLVSVLLSVRKYKRYIM